MPQLGAVHRAVPAFVLFACAASTACAALPGQAERHELGLRLRAFERDLDAATDPARRDAAYVELNRAVQAFFRFDTAAVAKAIDAAERALLGDPGTPTDRFARSLALALDRRLVATGDGELPFTVRAAWRPDDDDVPPDLALVLEPLAAGTAPARFAIRSLPLSAVLPLAGAPPGDHTLRWSIVRGEEVLVRREQGLSVAADLEARLAKLEAAVVVAETSQPPTIESRTLPSLYRLLLHMRRTRSEETILPGHRLLAEAEAIADAPPAAFYTANRPGSFWLRVPVGRGSIATRLFVPAGAGDAVPLVIAVHGAGGSENLFFDGYGAGKVVQLAAARGWFVVAPRNELSGVDCAALAEALAARYPIDLGKVLLVGHSMGAMAVVQNAGRRPERFAAVAALGGGGSVPRGAALARLPFFVGVGERDFALRQARGLHRDLEAAGAPSTLRLYPGVEHLAIVQIALPDVFDFFAASLTAAGTGR